MLIIEPDMEKSAQFANSRHFFRRSIPKKKSLFPIRTQEVIENKAQLQEREPGNNPSETREDPKITQENPAETQANPRNSRPPAPRRPKYVPAEPPLLRKSPPQSERRGRIHSPCHSAPPAPSILIHSYAKNEVLRWAGHNTLRALLRPARKRMDAAPNRRRFVPGPHVFKKEKGTMSRESSRHRLA
jgi:hypothetical protein